MTLARYGVGHFFFLSVSLLPSKLLWYKWFIGVWSHVHWGSKVQAQFLPKKKPLLWVVAHLPSIASIKVWEVRTVFRLIKFNLSCIEHHVYPRTRCTEPSRHALWLRSADVETWAYTLQEVNILLFSKWHQHPFCQGLMWNQHSNLLQPEVNIFELTCCVKSTFCSFLSKVNILAVRR